MPTWRRKPSHFNPRSPHGERRYAPDSRYAVDPFQSTLPARGATPVTSAPPLVILISIHAPRTGSDCPPFTIGDFIHLFQSTLPARGATNLSKGHDAMRHFNPRSPHGERQQSSPAYAPFVPFQSTLPARGATAQFDKVFQQIAFQSTLPARGATFSGKVIYQHILISIHAPRTGSDLVSPARP